MDRGQKSLNRTSKYGDIEKKIVLWNISTIRIILRRCLKMTPSLAMARMTLGRGNMAPNKLVERPNKAPIATTHRPAGTPTARKAEGSGVTVSCR